MRNVELTSYHQPEEFGKGQKEREDASPYVLPTSQNPFAGIHLGWAMCAPPGRTLSQDDCPETTGNSSHHHRTGDQEPCGPAVLLGSLTLLLSARAPLPNKVSCFASTCVSSDNSFLSVRQEPALGTRKGPPSCNKRTQRNDESGPVTAYIFYPLTALLTGNWTCSAGVWGWESVFLGGSDMRRRGWEGSHLLTLGWGLKTEFLQRLMTWLKTLLVCKECN